MECRRLLAVALLGLLALGTAQAQDKPTPPVRPSAQGGDPTDAQVLAAIHRGVDFLLTAKKGDHWETRQPNDPEYPNYGGHTAAALYALLYVGKTVDDPRLDARSPELAPALKWLCDLNLRGTYTAGFMANALGLVPGEKPEKMKGLATCRDYVMAAMGAGGGYSYSRLVALKEQEKFENAFENYVKLKVSGANPVAVDKAKEDAMKSTHYARYYFGGLELWCRFYIAALKEQTKKDPSTRARNDVLIAELDKFRADLRQSELTSDLPGWKRMLASYQEQLRTGKYGTKTDRDKKTVPRTKDDVEKDIAVYSELVARATTAKPVIGSRPSGDLSNGQYGALAAWGLEDARTELPDFYWVVSDHFWRSTQLADGMWPYNPVNGGEGTPTMTVAGIASLFVTSEYTDTEVRLIPQPDKNIAAGLAWLNANYAAAKPQFPLYYLYGCERVGLASGLKFFGAVDWYRQGAQTLLAKQQRTGAWVENDATIGTVYALLFLARGRNPLAFSKLEYNGYWNARPRDVAHLTEWMSKEAERPLNWQVVNLQHDPAEWADAPVLVITGSQDPKFTPADLAKLKAFVDSGGIVFSSADGGSDVFTAAMRKYAVKVCDNKYEMRELPKDHVLFSKDCWQPVSNPPRVLGMSNGARELWIHSPQDLGASWQRRAVATREHFVVPADVCFYAAGGKKEMRTRLQPLTVPPPKVPTMHQLALARISYGGNWDPEPGAWPRMAKLAAADYRCELTLSTAKLEELHQLDPKAVPVAHLTGTARFRATPEGVAALKAYLDKGGLLLTDATGAATPDFHASVLELLKQVYPEGANAPAPLAPDHTLYSGKVTDSEAITEVAWRKTARLRGLGGTAPRLQALLRDGKLKAIVSAEDLTSGLLGTQTQGILGYTPDSAESLVANILLWAGDAAGAEKK